MSAPASLRLSELVRALLWEPSTHPPTIGRKSLDTTRFTCMHGTFSTRFALMVDEVFGTRVPVECH
jgi:hypothetical protein